ncbi:LAETG motif-containing sortase-dependent surface protein [Kitasatospora sp. NPDC059722]|uniref:LAETG motif-containing sortase-dependent surface protein n=1 Tax=Kitasatospora sp. NPDC059722 TaxID=3346925 RepID=UPI0036BC4205
MLQLNRALRRVRSTVVPALVLTAGLVAGGAATAGPAFADASGPLSLSVDTPGSIAVGKPVEFTETITNSGTVGWALVVELRADAGPDVSADAVGLTWRDDMGGNHDNWQDLKPEIKTVGGKRVVAADAGKIIVPAGEKTEVHFRIGVTRGGGDGGVGPVIALRSELKGWRLQFPVDPPVSDTHRIKVTGVADAPKPSTSAPAPSSSPSPSKAKPKPTQEPSAKTSAPATGSTTSAPAAGTTSTETPAPTASTGATNATGATASAPAGQLASTGSDGDHTALIAGGAALLVGAGAGTLLLVRRRRTH